MNAPGEERSANDALLSRAILHAALLERFKNLQAMRVLRMLDREVLPDLSARLAARLENIATRGFDTSPTSTARLKFLYRDLRGFFDELASRLRSEIEPALGDFATTHAAQLARDLLREVGDLAPVVTPSSGTIRQAILRRPIHGVLLRDSIENRARSFRLLVEQQVQMGLEQGSSASEIVARVRDTFPSQRRRTALTVRSAVAHAQSQARQVTYEENADILRGVGWTATLDVSTCPACGELDGTVLPVDSGPRPPLHLGPCRCSTYPVLKSARELGGTRASMDGQVPRSVRWSEWVEEQSAARQDEIFGRTAAGLLRSGRVDVADLVDGAGRVLTLDRLEALAAR